MEKRDLISTLHKLHQELEQHPQFDAPTKESLRQIANDINQLLEPEQEGHDTKDVRDRLAKMVTEFELEHPTISRTLLDLSNILARIGI